MADRQHTTKKRFGRTQTVLHEYLDDAARETLHGYIKDHDFQLVAGGPWIFDLDAVERWVERRRRMKHPKIYRGIVRMKREGGDG
jgi:hypothetical protein